MDEKQNFECALKKAFIDMRKRGVLARMNFACCSSCGGAELHEIAKDMKAKGKTVKGDAFYHNQDNEIKQKGKDFYIGYTNFGNEVTAEEVANIVVYCLNNQGIATIWNGDVGNRIQVKQEIAFFKSITFRLYCQFFNPAFCA